MQKKGISLIVLVITIIVMIILASSVVISLTNTGIINRVDQAVQLTDEKQIQQLVDIAWADAYMSGAKTDSEFANAIEQALIKNSVDTSKFYISTTNKGVDIVELDKDNWDFAYTYNQSTGIWSDVINNADGITLSGDITVKFYKQEELVKPSIKMFATFVKDMCDSEGMPNNINIDMELPANNSYKMLIEGVGEIGELLNENLTPYAWQDNYLEFVLGATTEVITPYITEVIIEEGITNISRACFMGAASIRRIVNAAGVETINQYAFAYNDSEFKEFIIPSVSRIESHAFEACVMIKNIKLPDSLTFVGNNAVFGSCISLEEIEVPGSLTVIDERMFGNCINLKKVVIKEGVKDIWNNAFDGCVSLTEIVIPKSITDFGSYNIFSGCTNLKEINYAGTEEEWNNIKVWGEQPWMDTLKINYNYKVK